MPGREDLAADLARLGTSAGDAVVVHSSLRAIGHVDGGAAAVVAALLDALGDDGVLVAPTFTYWTRRFDPAADSGLTGRVAETVRTWPGAVRSRHPTHSVAAIGRDAAALVSGHELTGGLGRGSPLDRLAERDGSVLLIGVGHVANSTIHVGEAHAGVPYLDVPFRPDSPRSATVATPEGEQEVPLRQPPGCSRAFGAVEKALRDRGAVRDGLVGRALTQVVRGRAVIDATVDLLRSDPAGLLCTDPRCYRCTEARRCLETGANR